MSTRPAAVDLSGSNAGFSLLEALIALSILAIAAVALIGASEAHVDRVSGLEARAVASWVAEEKLAELRIAASEPVPSVATREMAGHTWKVETATFVTADADIRVSSAVTQGVLASLSGFIDVGANR